jgi:hypothetical protein
MKKVAILQSNYIPWRGYFDIVAAADEFILYDDMQFTKNDWRNRNKVKTPTGVEWITIPVGKGLKRRIRDVELTGSHWQQKHWRTFEANYRRAPHFQELSLLFEPVYLNCRHSNLSALNRELIEKICTYLGITTKISNSWDYTLIDGKTERIADLCAQAGGDIYISGPAAKDYIEETSFSRRGITLDWMDYTGYREYPQLWGEFAPGVTILDLLFNCGKDARRYMKCVRS